MIFAGITILVETKKGRLVIESDGAGVNVTLLRDGEVYDELKIEPGANSTTLLAGQYQIVVDGATDVQLLNDGKVEIKRGEVVVAKIRSESQAVATTPASLEPIFEGKPLGYWLETVVRERDHSSLRTAMNALNALRSPDNAKIATKNILQAMRGFREELSLSRVMIQPATEKVSAQYSSPLERNAFTILQDINQGAAYFDVIADELKTGDLKWQLRILKSGMVTNRPDDWDDFGAVIDWMESDVFAGKPENELLQACANYYWARANDSTGTEKQHAKLLATLVRTESLGVQFWLDSERFTEESRGSFSGNPRSLSPSGALELENRAVHALNDDQTDPQYQAQAAIALQILCSRNSDKLEKLASPDAVVNAVKSKMHSLIANPQVLLSYSPVNVLMYRAKNRRQGGFSVQPQSEYGLLKPSGEPRQIQQTFSSGDGEKIILAVELFRLIQDMNVTAEFAPELMKLYMATSELNEQLNEVLDENPTTQIYLPVPLPNSPATTEQWIAGVIHFRAFNLLAPATRAELTALAQRTHNQRVTKAMIEQHDSDADGEISMKEAAAVSDSAVNFDVNNNGKLEASEFAELLRKSKPQPNRANARVPNAAEVQWAERQIEKYDKNRDKFLTADEWAQMIIRPDGADLNGDGRISAEELANSRYPKK